MKVERTPIVRQL